MTQKTPQILAVDDEEGVRAFLEAAMRRAGYECLTAGTADEASELLQRKETDLVLLDIGLPGKSGIEFLPDIVAHHPDVAVVMLTAVDDTSTAVRAMREGAYDYAKKPVDVAELIMRVENALSRRALLEENRAYQIKQEQMVDELNARLEQRLRELTALNKLFQAHMDQGELAQGTFVQLRQVLDSFNSELDELASIAGVVPKKNPLIPPTE